MILTDELRRYADGLERLARDKGLDYYPVDFELVPPSFMTEVAVYGLPVRMPHWSFGVRYIYQLVQHRMGYSRLFEVVFPGNPGRAYLADNNSVRENTLVVAHVLGHADFAKNNLLFRASAEQVGDQFVEKAAAHARQIADAIDQHGEQTVEQILDTALALEQHIDINQGIHRPRFPEFVDEQPPPDTGDFRDRFDRLAGEEQPLEPALRRVRAPTVPRPEYDLLWFIANYAPELDDWERDIFLAVREESYYFYPVFACQIMNEGWASYWHAQLLREADFLPHELYLDAIKTHSDVVRPHAGDSQAAMQINPYHLGFSLWEQLIEDKGMDAARRIMSEEDDFGFIRNHLDDDMIETLQLFQYTANRSGRVVVDESDGDAIREQLVAGKFNFGAPRIAVRDLEVDGTLVLQHDHDSDGRGLDVERAKHVLDYIRRIWRRDVIMHTVNDKDDQLELRPAGL